MILYSTARKSPDVLLEEAVKRGLPPDNGLYMPAEIPQLPSGFLDSLPDLEFRELAYGVLRCLFGDHIPGNDLKRIIEAAFDFDAPLHQLDDGLYILELFHGPTLAFKDFGARFMGRLLEYFIRDRQEVVDILVATSGDTGSAVARGFLDAQGIRVTILFPKGKVSDIQERQFATLGRNIRVLEVDGTFDDCQRMVKEAFLDRGLNERLMLSSANSINIARLLPQALYYFRAAAQLPADGRPVSFSVPSGNFGNLTAGLIAKRMGLPIHKMIAANNDNDIFTRFWHTGQYQPKRSVQTLSNAMDVGDPSNFKRIVDLYGGDHDMIRRDIPAYAFSDEQTRKAIREVYKQYHYIMCPHTAVGYMGARAGAKEYGQGNYVALATAHPVKFKETVDQVIGREVEIPGRLKEVLDHRKLSLPIRSEFGDLRDFLLQNG